MGLPFLGETMAFGKNPFHFLEERQKRHGNVFKSSLFGRRIVFLAGTEGAEAFYNAQNISRADAHPSPLERFARAPARRKLAKCTSSARARAAPAAWPQAWHLSD
jgi:Cytochrome P450